MPKAGRHAKGVSGCGLVTRFSRYDTLPEMTLRTAPCPTCKYTIVFGERRCRSCGMAFDYGAAPPPEPNAGDVFDALAGTQEVQPSPPRPLIAPARVNIVPGLETGRFEVGEVEVEDIPGLVDSTLFKSMTSNHVDAPPIQGLEFTQQISTDGAVRVEAVPGLERRTEDVGDVFPAAIPGLFGSDLFRAGVDVAAGANRASDFLQVSPSAGRMIKSKPPSNRRTTCATCSSVHGLARCPSCGTAAPSSA